jgi:hypothetical protein
MKFNGSAEEIYQSSSWQIFIFARLMPKMITTLPNQPYSLLKKEPVNRLFGG